jgi:multicomponent Na+:H+ antiporter subunit E
MKIKTRSRIIVFIFAYFTWLALTGFRSSEELITGALFAALVSLAAGHFLITTEQSGKHILRRSSYFILYLIRFAWEMVKANVHVAYLVVHPYRPIKPGIVKINTSLSKDSSLTILCNSITLTPGTLTVDINKSKGEIYVHCIEVKANSVNDNTREIGFRFERILKEIFE